MSTVGAIVSGIIGIIPGILKHKPNCLWYWNDLVQKWELKAGPMSSRQCRLQMKTLISCGMVAAQFRILRAGVQPPPFFNPPKVEEKR